MNGETGEGGASTNYFLPFVRGQMLWHLTGSVVPCLKYMTHADAAVERSISVDKIDKRYRSLVVCELHKIRFRMCLRLLSGGYFDSQNVESISECDSSDCTIDVIIQCLVDTDASNSYQRKRPAPSTGTSSASQASDETYGDNSGGDANVLYNDQEVDAEDAASVIALCSSCGISVACSSLEREEAEMNQVISALCGTEWRYFAPEDTSSFLTPAMRLRLWQVAVDALKGLRSCRIWDTYDFKSVFLVALFLISFHRAKKYSALHWALPPEEILPALDDALGTWTGSDFLQGALAEIHKLFEKRRPQVVAMWTHENSPQRFDQWLQRIVVFDNLRCKVRECPYCRI